MGRGGQQEACSRSRVQSAFSSKQFNEDVVRGIQGFALVPQQGATSTQDHGSMRPVEAFNVHWHAGFLWGEHEHGSHRR